MPGRTPKQLMPGKLILASASPRRQELLKATGIAFEIMPSAIEEQQGSQESARKFVRRVAAEKALAVLRKMPPEHPRPVLAADTVVVINGGTLGKPASRKDARRMLRMLSGKRHRVLTGVCLAYSFPARRSRAGKLWKDVRVASTTVQFAPLSEQEIREYVASGESADKAGAYAIQGRACKFVERIEGCYSNVVGLPVSLVYRMLRDPAIALQLRLVTRRSYGKTKGR